MKRRYSPIISIFTKAKELEEENLALKKDIEKVNILNVRLDVQNKSLFQEKEENIVKIAQQLEEIERISDELDYLKSEHSIVCMAYHGLGTDYGKLLKKLSIAIDKKPNERGAGRKQSISSVHITNVLKLLNQGKSTSAISENLILQLDSSWKVAKVRYVMRRYLQQNEVGHWMVQPHEKE